ncbi:uncharacterized protein LOC116306981 [Actinia tenebrosa]|uniref:Uncharacterized protein LOC116306981 n=1 Tax=Actinia tenebrosa TaxID=6105 RepID=A0A6P8J6Y4_ACTTE|nr:uncharacterized protein LOC116306981 [Actinia tenebrosa]
MEEMQASEQEILKYVQRQRFGEELDNAPDGITPRYKSSIKRPSPLYKLDPVKVDGLPRVGGRLKNADIAFTAKHPIILPKKHPVIDLIRYYHLESGHSGQEYVLSLLREHYWIIKSRVTVRKILRSCFACKRRCQPAAQQMANLPFDRVTPDKPPFAHTGVDCFGPFSVKRGRATVKSYGVIFTCLTVRAIHLEVAFSLDTSSFINAMRRFVSRRGKTEIMRSDNGTNFKGGEKEIRQAVEQWNQRQIHEFFLQKNIRWIYNPPFASHMGGVWERNIRTVRKVMSALVKEQVLDDEGFTLLCVRLKVS